MSQSQRTILIIDDCPEDRELYRRYLLRDREYKYIFIEASLGCKGLDLWQRHQPDAVLLDYRLPDLDGLEWLAQLPNQAQQRCFPVIVVTGQGNEAIAVQAMKAGAQDYLVKEQMTPESLHLAVNGAIETVQLRVQLQQRLERERVVAQITRQIHQSLELDQILQTTVTEVRQFLHTDRVLIFRLQSDGWGKVITESIGDRWTPLLATSLYDACLGESYLQSFHDGLVTVKPDIHDGSIKPCHVELLASLQVRANLVVPILQDNQLWGMLIAHHCTAPRQWQPLEIELLQELANQAGIALKQAELYQQALHELQERQRVEDALRQQTARSSLVAQIAVRVRQTLDVNEILETTVVEVRDFLQADRVFVYRFGPDSSGRVIVESVGENWLPILDAEVDDRHFRETEGEDYLLGRIQRVDDIDTAPLSQCHLDLLARFQVRANLVVPILHGEGLWGLLVANQCSAPRQWQAVEIDLLKELTNQVGVAIHQAELYQQVQIELSERKQGEAALRESQALFEAFMRYSPATAYIKDEDGRYVYVNSLNERVCQRGSTDWIGKTDFELFEPHKANEYWNNDLSALVANQAIEVMETYAQQDAEHCYISYKFPIQLSVERRLLAGLSLDITDRKQAEEALRQSEEFKQRLLESSSDCIKILSLDGRLLYMNASGICLMQIDDVTPYINTQWSCMWQQQYLPEIESALAAAKSGRSGKFQGYCGTAKGTPKWWDVVVTPIRDVTGQVTQLLAVSRDISDRKQAEEALRESEARYRQLANSVPNIVWASDARGNINYLNQRWLEYTGLPLAEAMEKTWMESVHPDDLPQVEGFWDSAPNCHSNDAEIYEIQYRLKSAEGGYRWHLLRGCPVRDRYGCLVKWFGTFTDIHDRVEIQAERDRILLQEQAARAELERANRVKDEFLAVLSHELRSPLNPILGWTQLMQTRKLDAATTISALATIERNVLLQTQLIDDLLDVARILRGKMALNVEPVNLVFIIESALETVRTATVAKSIVIHPVLENIGEVSGDGVRLQQIVWNLLSNAIKFTPNGGQVEIYLERKDEQAQIRITDTGKGISSEFLPHIFEHFRQEDASITRKHGGLGLGLAIVNNLVAAHGGTISAQSPGEGQGATFTVRLPLVGVGPQTALAQESGGAEIDLAGIRVLLVDDELDTRELLAFILEEYGANVIAASSAEEFLELFACFKPDILVSDIGMPGMDGYALLRRVRSLPPQQGGRIPALALTAYARFEDRQQAVLAGFQGHISKPVDPSRLVTLLSELLGRR